MKKFLKTTGKALGIFGITTTLLLAPNNIAFALGVGGGGNSGGTSGGGVSNSAVYINDPRVTGDASITSAFNNFRPNGKNIQSGSWNTEVLPACRAALTEAGGASKSRVILVAVGYGDTGFGPYVAGTDKGGFKSNLNNTWSKTINNSWTLSRANLNGYSKNQLNIVKTKADQQVEKASAGKGSLKAICVAVNNKDLPLEYNFNKIYNKTETITFNALYSENISLKKQILAGPEAEKWQDQTKVQKTSYGNTLDDIIKKHPAEEKLSEATKLELKTKLNRAIENDKANPKDLNIDMNKQNQDIFADGGVVNVAKNTQERIANLTDNNNGTVKFTKCTKGNKAVAQNEANSLFKKQNMTRADIDNAINTINSKYGCKSEDVTNRTIKFTSNNPTTARPVSFWQMISVHCNKEGFENLYKEVDGATIINSGDESKKISAVMHSKRYTQAPPELDFGQPGTASGEVDFYDKECPFECTADPATENAKKNGADTNVINGSTSVGTDKEISNKYGAVSGEINGNKLTYFRDNVEKAIKVDLWYPVQNGNGVVEYDGAKAATTTITRWEEGTPDVTGSKGGKFVMRALPDGAGRPIELFKETGTNTKTQKNWNKGTDKSSVHEILTDQYTNFDVKASWASEVGKPQVLNFKWEYDPTVNTNIPTAGIGFNKDNGLSTGKITTVGRPIEGKCYANFGTEDSNDTEQLFQKNTGTNTKNEIDKGPIGGTGADVSTNLIIDFVRATTE